MCVGGESTVCVCLPLVDVGRHKWTSTGVMSCVENKGVGLVVNVGGWGV